MPDFTPACKRKREKSVNYMNVTHNRRFKCLSSLRTKQAFQHEELFRHSGSAQIAARAQNSPKQWLVYLFFFLTQHE